MACVDAAATKASATTKSSKGYLFWLAISVICGSQAPIYKDQRPLPGHAIAGWGFKTIIVMLPVVMLNARATSRISFAMGSLLSQKAIPLGCRGGMRAFNTGMRLVPFRGPPLFTCACQWVLQIRKVSSISEYPHGSHSRLVRQSPPFPGASPRQDVPGHFERRRDCLSHDPRTKWTADQISKGH